MQVPLRAECGSAGDATLTPTETAQCDGMGVLGWIYRIWLFRVKFRSLPDRFKHDLARKLVRIAGAFL